MTARMTAGVRVRTTGSWAFNRPRGLIAVGGDDPTVGQYGRAFLTLVRWAPGSLRQLRVTSDSALSEFLPSFSALGFNADGTRIPNATNIIRTTTSSRQLQLGLKFVF